MLLTERARAEICRQVGKLGRSVAELAREDGVGWQAAMTAVLDHGTPLVDDPARLAGVAAMGVDETAWLRATRHHHTLYVSGMVDLAARGCSTSSRAALPKRSPTGSTTANPTGLTASPRSRSTRTAATTTR